MSEHTTTPTDSCQAGASRRQRAKKPRPKKAGAGADGQRDAYGRFQAGNPGGFGNPYARQVAILRRELMQRTRPEEIREIGNKLVTLAKAGNVQAAKVILSYTLGLPTPAQQPDRVDADELTLFNEELELQASLTAQMKNPGLDVNLRHIRVRRLYNAYLAAKMLHGALTASPEERKRHLEETAGLPADQRALRAAELGEAKNWRPCHEQELLFKPWEPWPAEEAPAADAAPHGATPNHAAANHHGTNGHATANRLHEPSNHADNGAARNGAARNGATTATAPKNGAAHGVTSAASAPSTNGVSRERAANPATVAGARINAQTAAPHDVASPSSSATAPSVSGSNGKAPAVAPSHRGAVHRSGKSSAAKGATPTKRTIAACTRNILPKALRPRGMIKPPAACVARASATGLVPGRAEVAPANRS